MKKFPPKREDKSHIVIARPKHDFSIFQKKIFKEINSGTGNVIVLARAGSSKTTSLVEGSRYLPKGNKALFCAFNKSIQEELSQRLPSYVEALTIHSLSLRAIKARFGKDVEIDNYKSQKIAQDIVSDGYSYDLIDQLCKTVGFCKLNLVDAPSKIQELIIEYGIDYCEEEPKQFISYVCQILRKCKEKTDSVDFNDMPYFCHVYKLNVGKWNTVFLDEGQDVSKLNIEVVLSAVAPGGRIIVVMDDKQAIYSFAGADSKVLENLRTRLKPKEMSLPICYRCPKKIVELVKPMVPDIQAYDQAADGSIEDLDILNLFKKIKPGDYLLSRTNAPIIKLTLQMLKQGIPANMLGRDIGEGLSYLIKKSKKKSVKELLTWLIKWEKEEILKLKEKYPNASGETISDRAECIRMLSEGANELKDIQNNIEKLFQNGDEKKIVLASSIHKIKGKETNNVFVLYDTLKETSQEEINLKYISFTRAKKSLFLVKKIVKEEIY